MTGIHKNTAGVCWVFFGLLCLAGSFSPASAQEINEELFQMISEYIGDPDHDTRAMGLSYVRDEMPGAETTRRFTAFLPKLSPDGRTDLLDALADRGDAAACPAVLKMLESKEAAVRVAALRALGSLGSTAEVPLLSGKTVAGSDQEKRAARQSLARLRGDEINAAILTEMKEGTSPVHVELLGVLAARNAKEALPTVLKSTEDSERSVRLAALKALRYLADVKNIDSVVKILKATKGDAENKKAELAMLALCSRGGQACTDAIITGFADADVPSRKTLLRALARVGGPKALETIVARLEDDDEAVRDEAVRMLSVWPDPAAAVHLSVIAKRDGNLRHQVLAIRGLVRLARPHKDKPADIQILADVMKLAVRPQEKRLVLGALGGVGVQRAPGRSLALVMTALYDEPELAEEASLAAVMIAEKMKDGSKDELRTAMEKVLARTKTQRILNRAQKVLDSL